MQRRTRYAFFALTFLVWISPTVAAAASIATPLGHLAHPALYLGLGLAAAFVAGILLFQNAPWRPRESEPEW